MKLATLTDAEEYIRVLYYGDPGTGKTSSAATASHNGKIIVIDAEGGLKPTALKRLGINTDNIQVWTPPGNRVTADSLDSLAYDIIDQLAKDPGSIYAVVIDSSTEIHHTLLEDAVAARVKNSSRASDPDTIERGDYGVMTKQMRRIIRKFGHMPCNLIITALERKDDDGTTRPLLTPALGSDIAGYMDLVVYCRAVTDAGTTDYRALTKPDGVHLAKDRFGTLPRVLVNPTFARIHDYVNGELDETTDPLQTSYEQEQKEKAEERKRLEEEREQRRRNARG